MVASKVFILQKDGNKTPAILVKDESIDDTLRDLACYSMMMLAYRKRQIEKEHSKIDFE